MSIEGKVDYLITQHQKTNEILLGDGKDEIGLCGKVNRNTDDIKDIKRKPFKTKEWLLFLIVAGTFAITLAKAFNIIP